VRSAARHVEDQHGLPLAADNRKRRLNRAPELIVHTNLQVSSSLQSAFLRVIAHGRSVARH
jgi:hypothetical protein